MAERQRKYKRQHNLTWLGLLIIFLFGAGLIIASFVLSGKPEDSVSVPARVISVDHSRDNEFHDIYRPTYEYYVDGKRYTFTDEWDSFEYSIGSTRTIKHNKNTGLKLADDEEIIFLFVVGCILLVAGTVLTVKVVHDYVKLKRKKV